MEGKQNLVIDYLVQKWKKIITGGDSRCDSPGYLAKHKAYLITDMDVSLVLTVQLVLSPVPSNCFKKKKKSWLTAFIFFPLKIPKSLTSIAAAV